MELSQDFVMKCDGVPLAIVAISGLLSTKNKTVPEWKRVYDSLRSKFSNDPHLRSYYQVLSESYHDLPCHLKSCLLYFGLFPEDNSIQYARLIRLWIAEGFVKENEDQVQISEEVAEEYLTELIHRSLVKVDSVYDYGKVRSCKVHDLMHDFIVKKSEELNFSQVMENQEFRFRAWTRRLSIQEYNEDAIRENEKDANFGRVRSCLVCDIKELPKAVVKSLFSSFKLLVSLDLQDSLLDYLPEAIGNLLNLKYLSVQDTKIKTIPKFIGKLRYLETLNLKGTEVRELPVEVNKLSKLRHLIAYSSDPYYKSGHWVGVKLNEGIGCLTALQSLTKVDATDEDGVITEPKNLKKMKRLSIILTRQKGQQACCAIENMNHLCSLSIQATKEHEALDLESLVNPPLFLQRLYLHGRLERLPEWVSKLKYLVRISLDWPKLVEDPLPLLKGMSDLLEILLYESYEGSELHFQEGWFMKLKRLRLESMPGLRTLKIDEKALPRLEDLELGPCPQMKQVPDGIQNLEALTSVCLTQMPGGFVKDIRTRMGRKIKLYVS